MKRVRGILILDEVNYKSRLFKFGDMEVWVPRSVTGSMMKYQPDKNGHRECVFEVEEWFAEKNNL